MKRKKRMRRFAAGELCGAFLLGLMLLFAAVTVRAARMSVEAADEPSAEYLLYIAAEEQTPQTWAELVRAMEEEEEPFEGDKIEAALLERAVKIENVTVSHYCVCEKCCGKKPDEPGYGVTASGRAAAPASPWRWTRK